MTPLAHFEAVWQRCAQLTALHAYIVRNVTGVLQPDELLRAEWVARLSALDLYVHELIAQLMLEIFEGRRPATVAYQRFQLSNETVERIRHARTAAETSAAFDLEVRNQLGYITFQEPEKIADGMRMCSTVELWNEIALALGANQSTKIAEAKSLKRELSLIVRRRNRIAHEGDLQPTVVREPLPITQADLLVVRERIETMVRAIDRVV